MTFNQLADELELEALEAQEVTLPEDDEDAGKEDETGD